MARDFVLLRADRGRAGAGELVAVPDEIGRPHRQKLEKLLGRERDPRVLLRSRDEELVLRLAEYAEWRRTYHVVAAHSWAGWEPDERARAAGAQALITVRPSNPLGVWTLGETDEER